MTSNFFDFGGNTISELLGHCDWQERRLATRWCQYAVLSMQ